MDARDENKNALKTIAEMYKKNPLETHAHTSVFNRTNFVYHISLPYTIIAVSHSES
jgi:hypothetical protein